MDLATLRARLGRRVGFDGNTARLDGFINDAVQHVHGWRQDWTWARRTLQFRTIPPETGTAATATNGSRTVTGLSAATSTRTGAGLSLPDGVVYDINADDALTTTAYLTTRYGGATVAGTAAWKVYYDTYPLPPDCSQIGTLVLTGNGWTYHIEQQSLTPRHMKRLTRRDYESYPQYYALDSSNPIPAPWLNPTVASGGVGPLTGAYTYWYAFRNTATGEVGPLSEGVSFTASSNDINVTTIQTLQDYGKRVYRSTAGGSEPVFHSDIAATAVSVLNDNTADSILGVDASTSEYIGPHPQQGVVEKVRLWPPPDDEYTVSLTYFATQKPLYKDNDVPILPARFHQVVLDYAQALYMREQENWAAASRLEGRVTMVIEKMALEQDSDPSTVIQVGRGEPSTEAAQGGDGRWPRWVNQ